ncbi:MAG: hypothetical protein ABI863_14145 [Ginsengibacter sp.]
MAVYNFELLLNKESIVEWLRDGSGSPQRSEDYKRTARALLNNETIDDSPSIFLIFFIKYQ